MKAKNSTNERIKRCYFEYLEHADGKSEATIRQVSKAISRFEEFTGRSDLKTFDQKQALGFKASLEKAALAPATILSALNDLKRFLGWLALQPGYKLAIRATDIEYLSLSDKAVRAATSPSEKPFPTLQMVEKVVSAMPSSTTLEKRDRALLAFVAITGIRDGALITLKLKHFDAVRRLVLQNPSEVNTKFSKRIDTFLLPLDDNFEHIFLEWIGHLRHVELFAETDPLFPKTQVGQDGENCFAAKGISREHWANAAPVRHIFKDAFQTVDLPAFTPHRFRDMIVSEMYRRNLSIPEFKAWSQNLGHEGAMTTLTAYGRIGLEEQGRMVRDNALISNDSRIDEILKILRNN